MTSAWAALEEPWRVCLSLAWEAYGAGTIPVGAALVDGAGSATRARTRTAAATAAWSASTRTSSASRSCSRARGAIRSACSPRPCCPPFYLRRKPAGHVVQAFARAAPGLLAVAEALLAAGAPDMAAAGVPLPEALPELWRWLEP
jgi:hypothetical protein